MKDLPSRLKALRGNLTQAEFADVVGISTRSLSRYENGLVLPDLGSVSIISAKTGARPQWIIFGEGPMYDEDKVHLVHARVGGGPNALRCGYPSSTIELRPEYKEEIERNAALEGRAVEAARGAPPCVHCREYLDRLLAAYERLDQVQEQAKALLKENGDLKAEIGELREALAVSKKILAENGLEEDMQRSA